MSDFFEDLGKRISDVAGDLGKRTEDAIEVQKIRSSIRSLKRANERDFIDIGRLVYHKFRNNDIMDTDSIVLCGEIEKREEEIGKQEDQMSKIKEGM